MNEIKSFNFTSDNEFNNQKQHIHTLFTFIYENDEDGFNNYLNQFPLETIDLNVKDRNGNYLLYLAVIKNDLKIVKNLIENRIKLDIIDSDGYSILYIPIKLNYSQMIDLLLNSDNNLIGISLVNIKDKFNETPLFYAIKYTNIDIIKRLLSNGADPNFKNKNYMNSLHKSILKKNLDIVRLVLPYINNINNKTITGYTALQLSCSLHLIEISELLLINGAEPNVYEFEYEIYPIFYPVIENNNKLTTLLLKYGSDINRQDYLGNTILHYSIINDNIELLNCIFNKATVIKNNNSIFDENINNKSQPLFIGDTHKIIIYSNIVNVDGFTICHSMLYKEDVTKYVTFLEKIISQFDLNYQDNNGNTILFLLVKNNLWLQFSNILKNKKLNIYITNNNNQTIFDIVNLEYKKQFLKLISTSYLYILLQHPDNWTHVWQNKCSMDSNTDECLKLIKHEIKNNKTSIPIKKTNITVSIYNDLSTNFTSFTGSLLDTLCGYKYLLLKYPRCATILSRDQTKSTEQTYISYETYGVDVNLKQHIIFFEIIWLYQRIILPPNFEKTFIRFLKSNLCDFIIIPIGIILSNGNHSNALLYNKKNNTIERFEPHGSSYPNKFNYNPKLLDETLFTIFSNIIYDNINNNIIIKYVQPVDYLPKIGFQNLDNIEISLNKNIGDPNGFCTMWCIWYLDYRLQHSELTPFNLVKKLINDIKQNNYSFRTIIRNYSTNITTLRDQYLLTIDKNINEYINNKFTQDELNNLMHMFI